VAFRGGRHRLLIEAFQPLDSRAGHSGGALAAGRNMLALNTLGGDVSILPARSSRTPGSRAFRFAAP